MESTMCTEHDVYVLVRRLLSVLPRFSRLVLRYDGDPLASAASIVATIRGPQLWMGIQPVHDVLSGPPWTHVTLSVRVHAIEFARYVQETYGLPPIPSNTMIRRAAFEDAHLEYPVDDPLPPDHPPDMRFWSVVHHVSRRGPLGLLDDHRSAGWWGPSGRNACLHSGDSAPTAAQREPIMKWHDLLEDPSGCLFLETHVYMSSGKQLCEWALCGYDQLGRLRIKALDPLSTAPLAPPAPVNQAASDVPFNLQETPQQRERREQVPLPFAYQLTEPASQPSSSASSAPGLRGTTGQSTIFFEPESEDDEDEDDPDDDLDL